MNKKVIVGCSLFYILSLSIYFFLPQTELKTILQYSAILGSLLIAALGGVYALKEYGLRGIKSKTLLLLTGGIISWFIGEILWSYFEYFLHISPFPSIADLFYLIAYPLFFFALIHEIRLTHVKWSSLRPSILFMMLITALLFAVIVSYFGIYLAYSPAETLLTNVIAISYGIADLFLIFATLALLVLAWEFKGGALSYIWMSLFFSFLFTLIADILFAMFTEAYDKIGSFTRGGIDSIWILSYLLFAYALLNFGLSIQSARSYLLKLRKAK